MSNIRQIPAMELILICLTFVVLVKSFYSISCCFSSGAEDVFLRPSMPSAGSGEICPCQLVEIHFLKATSRKVTQVRKKKKTQNIENW